VRQVLPEPASDVTADVYAEDARPAPAGRPWVLLDMVSSVDGAIAVEGRSRGLSSPADQAVFAGLRAIADVVLVGAGTVRAERYGPPRASDEVLAARRGRGQTPRPTIAIVSGRLDLDPDMRVFSDADARPVVITSRAADAARRHALDSVADVVVAGEAAVDLTDALSQLASQRGTALVTCEGGPTLNGALLAADLVDELCLTLSAVIAGGASVRAVVGSPEVVRRMRLARVVVDESALFLRYVRVPD
jgi:riboflavin-specific deaminase-like protein